MRNIREWTVGEIRSGVECPECHLLFFNLDGFETVRLADATLLFCPECKIHLGVLTDDAVAASA